MHPFRAGVDEFPKHAREVQKAAERAALARARRECAVASAIDQHS
jgi:hypothetical protein